MINYIKILLTLFFVVFPVYSPVYAKIKETEIPSDPSVKKIKAKYGEEFLKKLKILKISPSLYVYAVKLTTAGLKKLVQAEYDDALYLFKKAYGKVKSPNLLFYMGITCKGMGEYLNARNYFKKFTRDYPRWTLTKVEKRRIITAKNEIKRMEKKLVSIHLKFNIKNINLRINTKTSMIVSSGIFWIKPGKYTFVFSKERYKSQKIKLILKAGQHFSRKIEMITLDEIEILKRNKFLKENSRKEKLFQINLINKSITKKYEEKQFRNKVVCYSSFILGGGAIIAGVYYGVKTISPSSKVENASQDTPWSELKKDYEEAEKYRKYSETFFIAGGLFATVGLVSYFYLKLMNKPKLIPTEDLKNGKVSFFPILSSGNMGIGLSIKF